jgi:hypothetical protein
MAGSFYAAFDFIYRQNDASPVRYVTRQQWGNPRIKVGFFRPKADLTPQLENGVWRYLPKIIENDDMYLILDTSTVSTDLVPGFYQGVTRWYPSWEDIIAQDWESAQ